MIGFRSAIAFLTILPAGSGRTQEGTGLASARGWFPAVGLLIGAALATLEVSWRWIFTGGSPGGTMAATASVLLGAVVATVLVVLTRALHLDGFMDTCDALLGGSNPDHRLRILKDPHVGAFAVVGVGCLLLAKTAAISALPWQSRPWTLILVPCLSRGVMLLVMESFPYVGGAGLAGRILSNRGRGQMVFGLTVTVVAGLALVGPWSLAMFALAALLGWSVGAWATRLLGGVTGDVYGAVNELVEALVLLFAVLVTARTPAALAAPLFMLSRSGLP